jgi:hypothetical protein
LFNRRFRFYAQPAKDRCALGLISLSHVEEISLRAKQVLLKDRVNG